MSGIPFLGYDAVLQAVSPRDAIEQTRDAFIRHRRREWVMPAKVYLDAPPNGDFRAMPALGGGFAMLKWISSFPSNPARGLPTVMGIVLLSDASTSAPVAIVDARSVTALRTGAVAAVAAQALAAPDAAGAGIIGAGLHGAWAARCLAAAGYAVGVCFDARAEVAEALAAELGAGWRSGTREEALACDVVTCVTPGHEPVVFEDDLHDGLHLNMLGADGPGKAEATVDAVVACELYCDEWEQAAHGGELTGAVEAGRISRPDVIDLGAVLTGDAGSRSTDDAVTLFDSTGLAIQDLAIAVAALSAARAGKVDAPLVEL
jgi:ornithine cyclodeaminase/alanine dehydrogenase-like protein (mu-crystallin family)